MAGYQLSNVDMERLVGFLCCFCSLVLRDPVQTMMCGHRFCRNCLECMISTAGKSFCPVDNELIKNGEVFTDKFAAREILSTSVSCLFVEEGCTWKGELRQLEVHLNSACSYVRVQCFNSGCEEALTRSSLARHLTESCQHRIVNCKDCGKEMKFLFLQSHVVGECPVTVVECPQCHERIQRCKIPEHVDPDLGTCPCVEAPCPFVRLGCGMNQDMKRSERDEHHQLSTVAHLNLILRNQLKVEQHVLRLANEMSVLDSRPLLASKQAELVQSLQNVSEETKKASLRTNEVESQFTALAEKVNSCVTESRVSGIEETVNSLLQQVTDAVSTISKPNLKVGLRGGAANNNVEEENENSKRQLTLAFDMIRRLEKRIDSQDHMLTLKNIGMADLEERLNDISLSGHSGQLIWRIHDVAKRRHDALTGRQTSFYSVPFHTSKYGYKLCGRIYFNGDGIGKGTHLSLFLVVMRGLYDAILPWPFKQRVTMTLIDQDHRQNKSDMFTPDVNSSSFKRPTTDMNIASGCPMFCSLSELESRAYIRDDTMFIKIKVDKNNLEEFE